jgi:hypothetical protein
MTVPLKRLALTGLEAPLRLINDVDAALAPDDAIVTVPATQRFQRVTNLHGDFPCWQVD